MKKILDPILFTISTNIDNCSLLSIDINKEYVRMKENLNNTINGKLYYSYI